MELKEIIILFSGDNCRQSSHGISVTGRASCFKAVGPTVTFIRRGQERENVTVCLN